MGFNHYEVRIENEKDTYRAFVLYSTPLSNHCPLENSYDFFLLKNKILIKMGISVPKTHLLV